MPVLVMPADQIGGECGWGGLVRHRSGRHRRLELPGLVLKALLVLLVLLAQRAQGVRRPHQDHRQQSKTPIMQVGSSPSETQLARTLGCLCQRPRRLSPISLGESISVQAWSHYCHRSHHPCPYVPSKAYLITLPGDEAKVSFSLQQLKAIGLDVEVVQGVDGTQVAAAVSSKPDRDVATSQTLSKL